MLLVKNMQPGATDVLVTSYFLCLACPPLAFLSIRHAGALDAATQQSCKGKAASKIQMPKSAASDIL